MGVNSLPKAVTRQRLACDLNPGPSAPESSTLTILGYRATSLIQRSDIPRTQSELKEAFSLQPSVSPLYTTGAVGVC